MKAASPAHTPYDGSSTPFTIGLRPLDFADWIEIDRHYEAHLAEKRRLYAELPERVFVEEPDTRDAQREVLNLLVEHLKASGNCISPGDDQRRALAANLEMATDATHQPALKTASLLVQEDLVLMRRGEGGWRLAAASLCFPSSWTLLEKFGRPLQDIHQPVPDFGPGTRNAGLIERMFDSLQGQGVIRWNWSMQLDDALYNPFSMSQRGARAANRPSRFGDQEGIARCFIRVERQTLRKLPVSRDILFTIRIHLDPLMALANHPDRTRIATSFADQLAELEQAQLDYKGLAADRDHLVKTLRSIAGSG